MAASDVVGLTAETNPTTADLLYLAISPFGPTDDRKLSIGDLLATALTNSASLTGRTATQPGLGARWSSPFAKQGDANYGNAYVLGGVEQGGRIDVDYINPDQLSASDNFLDYYFCPPVGCTQVRFRFKIAVPTGVTPPLTLYMRVQFQDTAETTMFSPTATSTSWADVVTAWIPLNASNGACVISIVPNYSGGSNTRMLIDNFQMEVDTATQTFFAGIDIKRVELRPAMLDRNLYPFRGGFYGIRNFRHSPGAGIRFLTNSTQVGVQAQSTVQPFVGAGLDEYWNVGCRVDRQAQSYAALNGAQGLDCYQVFALPAGEKIVEIVAPGQTSTGMTPLTAVGPLGIYLKALFVDSDAYIELLPPQNQPGGTVLYGNSITQQNSGNGPFGGLARLLDEQGNVKGPVYNESWGSRSLFEDYTTGANSVTPLAQIIGSCNPSCIILFSIETNDYGLSMASSVTHTAANFGTRLGELFTALESTAPAAQVYYVTALTRSVETINNYGSGNALADYRTAGTSAASGHAKVTVISGPSLCAVGDLTDGVHLKAGTFAKIMRALTAAMV